MKESGGYRVRTFAFAVFFAMIGVLFFVGREPPRTYFDAIWAVAVALLGWKIMLDLHRGQRDHAVTELGWLFVILLNVWLQLRDAYIGVLNVIIAAALVWSILDRRRRNATKASVDRSGTF